MQYQSHMRKGIRLSIIVFGSLIGLLILLWLGLALYIRLHKAAILAEINAVANERLHGGQLQVGDMEPSLVKSFPDVSVTLKDVTLRDSLWTRHHHDLLKASKVFVKVNTFLLLRNRLNIKQITIEDGLVYLFTDSTGYNTADNLFKPKTGGSSNSKGADIKGLKFDHVQIVIDNQQKGKLFHFDIHDLDGRLQRNDSGFVFHMHTKLKVKALTFNVDRGSFLQNQELETDLHLQFNRIRKTLVIPQQRMDIGNQTITAGAAFDFIGKAFMVHVTADQTLLSTAASWLTPTITAKLDSFHVAGPLDADCVLQGQLGVPGTPLVKVTWKTTNNNVRTKALLLDSCSFAGSFTNEWHAGGPHTDDNSIISIYSLKTLCYSIPITCDTLHISDLTHPLLTGYFRSQFALTDLNDSSGVFAFSGGQAKAELYYKGGIDHGDTIVPYLSGYVQLQQGAMTYLPRNLQFNNCNARLDFNGQDLFLDHITLQNGKSQLQMEGNIHNITRLYFTAPEKLELNWSVRSPMLDLGTFRSFLGKRRVAGPRRQNRVASQLDVMLASCNVNLQVQVDKLIYNHFMAQQVKADLSLSQSDILLRQIALAHAGGTMQVSGSVKQDGANNFFKLNAGIRNVHIDQLFYAFDDFGMQSLRSKNLQGIFSAKANIGGNIRDNGTLAPRSLSGTLDFELKNGALLHFAPLEDIGDIAFRRRNFSDITFDNVKNTLTLQGDKVTIPPMQINSSALYMDVQGVYGLNAGTDLYIDVPLRNPKRDEDITDEAEKKKRSRKGFTLHLHAADGPDGKVKIKLGSQKKD
jgi:hypothetical protein